jgi:FtsP/CotA-like multicopper oxidase with cupredoxin domain
LLLPQSARKFAQPSQAPPPDYTIEIADLEWELAPRKKIHTTAYNGQIPGKLLRLTEGKPVTIDIINRLDRGEIVHWHGQWIPPAVDGSMEEGTPMIPPGGRTRIQFTPRPSGLHWYHTHTPANRDLRRGLYSGQFGPLLVEPRENPGWYDQEQFVILHEWEPYVAASDDGSQEIQYASGSINGRMLGHGDPIQVKEGQRVLFHILNASATLVHWLALPGHRFEVLALDGHPAPTRAKVEILRLGPAERISALVTMDTPGVWILGETIADLRGAGLGTIVEYAGETGKPEWKDPVSSAWDYRAFADTAPVARHPDVTVPLVFTSKFQGHGAMDRWMINGKSFPDTGPVLLKQGLRHRLVFDNRSKDHHPIHLHRHAFELVSIQGAPTSGVYKDVVMVKGGTIVEADLVADNPGNTLFHCHQQDHMDMGFMTLFRYV